MSFDPATGTRTMLDPNGTDAVLLRPANGGVEIIQARALPNGGHEVVETITIGPDLLKAFAEAAPAAVGAVLASRAPQQAVCPNTASTASLARGGKL